MPPEVRKQESKIPMLDILNSLLIVTMPHTVMLLVEVGMVIIFKLYGSQH